MQVKDFTFFSFSSCAEGAEVMQAEEAMVMKTVGTKVIGSGDGEKKVATSYEMQAGYT